MFIGRDLHQCPVIKVESRNAEILTSVQTREANSSVVLRNTAIVAVVYHVAHHTLPCSHLKGEVGNREVNLESSFRLLIEGVKPRIVV